MQVAINFILSSLVYAKFINRRKQDPTFDGELIAVTVLFFRQKSNGSLDFALLSLKLTKIRGPLVDQTGVASHINWHQIGMDEKGFFAVSGSSQLL